MVTSIRGADAKFPYTQSRQSRSNDFTASGVDTGQNQQPLGSFYRRKRAQLGAPKAITATARKLGCLIYRLIKKGQAYKEPDLLSCELKYKDQILNTLRKRANSFGFDLVELTKAA